MSQREAAIHYKIPKSVIQLRVSGKVSLTHQGAGRPTTLIEDQENIIVECLIARAEFGYPCDRMELMHLVGDYARANNIKSVFKDGTPGEDWYLGFMKRHPQLSLKKAEHLQTVRKNNTTPDIVYDFYEKLDHVYKEKDLLNINKASFIFNADESGFRSDPSRFRGIGEKGKSLCRVSGGSGRESTTVLACASADGSVMPPMILFKGVTTVQPRWVSDKAFPGTQYAVSASGWMEGPVFLNWFTNAFIPHIAKVRNEKNLLNQAVVLIFDGHNSHITLNLVKLAMNNNITLIKLPSHLTDKLQPLDKCVFGPVKTHWEKILVDYGKSKMGHSHQRLTKREFAELLGEVWRISMTPANIKSGFKNTGIFPLDLNRFPENQFNPIHLKIYSEKKKQEKEKNEEQKKADVIMETLDEEINRSLDYIQASTSEATPPLTSKRGLKSTSQDQENLVHEIQERKISQVVSTPDKSTGSTSQSKSVLEIFAETLKSSAQTAPTNKNVKTRLKPNSYGEVLTSKEVVTRLKIAEAEKQLKEKRKQEKKKSKDVIKRTDKQENGQVVKKRRVEKTKEKNESHDPDRQKNKQKKLKLNKARISIKREI